MSGFAQLGFASPSTNRFGYYAGAGIVAAGWLGRDADQIGISMASAQEGSTYRRNASLAGAHPSRAETTWELSYLYQHKSWLTLSLDVQFVNHPNADAARHGALVIQLRSEISL